MWQLQACPCRLGLETSMGVLGASFRFCQPNWEANCSLIGGQRKDPFLFLGIRGLVWGNPIMCLDIQGRPLSLLSSSLPSPR